MDEIDGGEIGRTYGHMLWHHMHAMRQKNEPKRKRLFDAIEVMCEAFPAGTTAWEQYHGTPEALDTKEKPAQSSI